MDNGGNRYVNTAQNRNRLGGGGALIYLHLEPRVMDVQMGIDLYAPVV